MQGRKDGLERQAVDGDRVENDSEWRGADEARRRNPGDVPGLEAFNALLRRTLALPPKPHSEMKLGKPRARKRKPETSEDNAHGVQARR